MGAAKVYEPADAKNLILGDDVPSKVVVDGALNLDECKDLVQLPRKLQCFSLSASATPLESLPSGVDVDCEIVLQNCHRLKRLPKGLTTGTLDLRGCSMLKKLPEELDVWFLNVAGCTQLASLPQQATIRFGSLSVAGCELLSELPDYLTKLATLDISDCRQITTLPKNLQISQWIDIGGSGLTELPKHLKGVGLRWRGVAIDERIAFRPEELSAVEALKDTNTERRRVMIERMGYDRFLSEADAKTLDSDTDPGGPRKLHRVPLENDEDIVCLSCSCPSTGRHYLLRVPPTVTSCHEAAAWMAGFDDPSKYKPVIET